MAVATYSYQVVQTLAAASGIPADAVQMTFCYAFISAGAPTDSDFLGLAVHLQQFFNATPGGGADPLSTILSNSLGTTTGANLTEFFRLPVADGDMGTPVYTNSWTLDDHMGPGIPAEVAICLSYSADLSGIPERSGSTRPASRRRGRIFIGPLGTNAIASDVDTGRVFVPTDVRENILACAETHLFTGPLADDWYWQVFSRAGWTTYPVIQASVDDAFDTQRRRGEEAVVRTTNTF